MQNLQITDKNSSEKEFVLFTLKEQTYGIESKSVLEISKLLNLESPEKLPPEVVGVLEYNSLFINVIDLKSVLNLEVEKYTTENQILIVTTEETIMGLVVDKVLDIKKIPQSKIQPPPYLNENSYTKGLCTLNEKNIVILNLNSVDNRTRNLFEAQNYEEPKESLFPTDYISRDILNERSIQLHKKLQNEQLSIYNDNEKSITFEIGDEIYCLDISQIKNFYRLKNSANITKVPCTPSFIVGLLNVKGDFVAVIDLREYLNYGKTYLNENSIVIILEAGDYKLGILADKIGQRLDITNELENARRNINPENRPEIINFVKDEIVYSILLVEELLKNERLHI